MDPKTALTCSGCGTRLATRVLTLGPAPRSSADLVGACLCATCSHASPTLHERIGWGSVRAS